MQASPITKLFLDGREFLVKRDDLIDPYLAGNKYRKLYKLLKTPKESLLSVISYGGTQSNAMLALAALCQKKGWQFVYYTKPVSQFLKEHKEGNYADALSLGMEHRELEENLYREFIASLCLDTGADTFVVHQGGADEGAQEGVEVLAEEILHADIKVDAIVTPSGTGTTALFLAKALPMYKIYTTPSIGSVEYLQEQMSALATIPPNLTILQPKKKYHFAKPYREFLEIQQRLEDAGVCFDLLYAPLMWLTLLEQCRDEKILYVHSGGVSGNTSMLKRYEKKFGKRGEAEASPKV